MATVNQEDLRSKVKEMYKKVAEEPHGEFHFEMGRTLAEKVGYSPKDLDNIPSEAVESYAGVGYHFDLADIKDGENVLDLGSGSGTDAFMAAMKAGEKGKVVGMDMTDEQLEKARKLDASLQNVSFKKGYIEELPFDDESFDVVISNGVINLCADKEKVFKEIGRVLKPGGRMAISDIVTEKELTEGITCNSTLWAACIGGAMQQDKYKEEIESGGMKIVRNRENPQYHFISDSSQWATDEFGVKSVSILAEKLK